MTGTTNSQFSFSDFAGSLIKEAPAIIGAIKGGDSKDEKPGQVVKPTTKPAAAAQPAVPQWAIYGGLGLAAVIGLALVVKAAR